MTAQQAAAQDIKSETPLYWDEERNQYNVSVSHLFTKENRRLNKQLNFNTLNS